MKKIFIIIGIVIIATGLFAKPKMPKNVKVLFTNSCGNQGTAGGSNTCLTVVDVKTNEIWIIEIDEDKIDYVCKTGMKYVKND